MTKNIYIVRHAEAEGQDPQAKLTERGLKQAGILADFLSNVKVERIISSPYVRAIETMRPFAERNNLNIELDDRLTERVLSTQYFSDWMDKLEATFFDMNLKYKGGESSHEAQSRIVELFKEVLESDYTNTLIVAHGGIISLLLNYCDGEFGFENWKQLSNPDVFLITGLNDSYQYKRLWND